MLACLNPNSKIRKHVFWRLPATHARSLQHLSAENFNKISQRMGQLQQELKSVHEREADREKGNELSLETIEALINAKDEDTSRRFREQTEQNAHSINTVWCRYQSTLYNHQTITRLQNADLSRLQKNTY